MTAVVVSSIRVVVLLGVWAWWPLAVADQPEKWVEVRSAHFVVSSNAAEADARRIAEQFEQIRAVFHNSFGNLRVDPPQPVVILAARDESTMKMLAPDE